MTENELRDLVEKELAAYLTEIKRTGEPYVADPAAWEPHAAVIAAAAITAYRDQGAPNTDPYGVNQTTTLATQIQQSNLLTGVPDTVNKKLGTALVAGGTAAVLAILAVSSPAWAALIAGVGANVFLWALASGAFTAALASGATHKTWRARNDDKTRPNHRVSDGQTVPIGAAFIVGGWPMRYPHDPLGPAEETINCRCKLTFSRR